MKIVSTLRIVLFFVVFSLMLNSSCRKFEGDQSVPAYIKIEKFKLNTNTIIEGANSTNISDAWVFIDEKFHGVFELPAEIPILQNGIHQVKISPGVKFNGNSDIRGTYPLYSNFVEQEFMLEENKVIEIKPEINYADKVDFIFNEAFEDNGAGLQVLVDTTLSFGASIAVTGKNYAQPSLVKMEDIGVPTLTNDSEFALGFYTDTLKKMICIRPNINFDFFKEQGYRQDLPVFIELDFRSDLIINLAMIGYNSDGTITFDEFAGTNAKDDWTKIYFNITPFIARNFMKMDRFNFYLISPNLTKEKKNVFIDNLKLIHR